ncbi:MAG: HlyC/CorC family transporter [Chloroflexi bacterium]|nr:HlyC/CorC family transporter [Chloroflexota bacterium]
MDDLLRLVAVLLLVLLNGFFVATEFALVAVRRTRVEQLASQDDRRARRALHALDHLDLYIAATQLGITMASLALGWIGEPALAHLIEGLLARLPFVPPAALGPASHSVAIAVAFATITALHIVLGELAPKSLALQRAEATVLAVVGPMHVFLVVFRPVIMALNAVGNALVRLFGLRPASAHALAHTEDELIFLFRQSRAAGVLEADEERLLSKVFTFVDLEARQMMVPRPEMVCIPVTATYQDVLDAARTKGFSRLPVYEHDLDHIIGVLHVKDLLGLDEAARARFGVRALMREPLFLPEAVPIHRLLAEFRRRRRHMAILIDEFGGTAGLVTVEDAVEELLGELRDEEREEAPAIQAQPDGSYLLDGLLRLDEVNAHFDLRLADEEVDTIGGLVVRHLGRMADVGDEVQLDGLRLRVEELDGRRVARVRLWPPAAAPAEPGDVPHEARL